ncbi:DUF881 domain-containing protein [Patescibacteria group bacterium]
MKFSPPKLKKPSQPALISFILAIIVGFLLTTQFYSTKQVEEVTDPDLQKNQALEVSILSASNTDLRQEVTSLRVKQQEYDNVLSSRLGGSEALASSLATYQEVSGLGELTGSGVTVMIDGPVLDVHLLDLLNNLRNIGVQGVALNGERIVFDSSILPDKLQIRLNGEIVNPPYRFDAVGNADLLESSLLREGGLLEQLGQTFPEVEIDITKKDSLTLPAYRGIIRFDYARSVDD